MTDPVLPALPDSTCDATGPIWTAISALAEGAWTIAAENRIDDAILAEMHAYGLSCIAADRAARLEDDIGCTASLQDILDGRDTGEGVANPPWEPLRRRVLGLVAGAPAIPPGWPPIETAPKDGSYILVSNVNGVWVAHWQPTAQSGYRFHDPWRSVMLNHWHMPKHVRHQPPTNWMPLPAPPESTT